MFGYLAPFGGELLRLRGPLCRLRLGTHDAHGSEAYQSDARACVAYMALAGVSVFLFWKWHTQSEPVITGLLCATGFFVYGPQCLLAIACANLATKRAAATAVGLTSIFGYASTTLSGWGMGFLVHHYGWDAGFACMVGCTAVGTLLFALAWQAKAHGYDLPVKNPKS